MGPGPLLYKVDISGAFWHLCTLISLVYIINTYIWVDLCPTDSDSDPEFLRDGVMP